MRNLLTLFAIALAVVVSSCSTFDDTEIWNKLYEHDETLTNHEKRILALEELCKQMNTNITALQTIVEALEKNDYVTNVSPITKDGNVIGYTISFAKSGTITIYNGADGKDGADGADGKDGYTPQIGVKQASDGYYYWTVDGEWLLDDDGNKIRTTGDDGKDGVGSGNGENGADGKDGITPRLKIENDYWYVSYDDGITWTKLGRATGEDGKDGVDGEDGEDGNNLFDGVFVSISQDAEYVYIYLADGNVIILPKEEMKNIHFIDYIVKTICCANWDSDFDGELSYEEAKAVTDIGQVFSSCDIYTFNEFTYFSSVTNLPAGAFRECMNLKSITIPDSVTTIGSSAFSGCDSLTSVTIPDSVTTIGDYAFYSCKSLTSVTIPDSVTTIGYMTFYSCKSLTSVTIGDSVTTIGNNAFSGCSRLTSITIPDSVTTIGAVAFGNCSSLTSVTIPDSVTTIGRSAFSGCSSLTSVTIPDSVTTIESSAFYSCESLASITIPDSVTTIGDCAFQYCKSLTSVTIPDSVTTIGGYAFASCDSLKEFKGKYATDNGRCLIKDNTIIAYAEASGTEYTIPDSVTTIGGVAFYDCDSLTSVTIPDSVTTIGNSAFSECDSLTSVYCKATTPPSLGERAFKYYSFGEFFDIGCTIYVPTASVNAYKTAEGWRDYANYIFGYDF